MTGSRQIETGVLRKDVVIVRRNPVMLFDRQADAYYRISERAAGIIAYMTGVMPVRKFQEKLFAAGIAVTEDELISLVLFLEQNNLFEPSYARIAAKQHKLASMREKSRFMRLASLYMYFRLPPWHPEKFFESIAPFVSFLASKFMVILLAIPAALGFLLAIRDFPQVQSVFMDTLSWAGVAKYFAAILFLKIVHEAAHSLAAIRFKCRVRGIGIGFMVFYPRLYTDTTDSWLLPRHRRLLIDAAGVIAELLIGGIAALFYFYLPPGAWQSTMFYIFTVSTISTLLVNGNPCIRYDGYYILCDLTGIDNLMTRSGEYVRQFWRYYILHLGKKPAEKHGWFLLLFGITSFIYRIFLYTAIIMVIYHSFIKVVAVILLILEVYVIFVNPCIREIVTIRELSRRSAGKAGMVLGIALVAFLGALLFTPLNWSVEIDGLTVPLECVTVVAGEGGYLTADLPHEPVAVTTGENLFILTSPQLDFAVGKMQSVLEFDRCQFALEELDAERFSQAKITGQKIISDERALEELLRRRAALTVTSPADGIFRVENAAAFRRGRYIPRGTEVGTVISPEVVIYAYADDHDAGKLQAGDRAVIRVDDSMESFPAVVTAVSQVAVPLFDSPLLQVYGGRIPMYQNENAPGFHSVRLYYRIELRFAEGVSLPCGRRVRCEIDREIRLIDLISRAVTGIFRREF